ncbi:MAG: response regulator transcription factor [Nonomuraea sp.]|nr:response regulator transcription factor [Nonomuraea sp.]
MAPPMLVAADTHEVFDTLILSCSDISREQAVSLAVRAKSMGMNVLLLCDGNQEESLEIAASIPSNGFLMLQDLTAESMEKALTGVRNGEMPMPGGLANHLLTSVRRSAAASRGRTPYLTPREQQALGLLAEGLSNKQIARRLGISQHGVKRLVANVLAKLNCPNRTLAVAVALRDGLV